MRIRRRPSLSQPAAAPSRSQSAPMGPTSKRAVRASSQCAVAAMRPNDDSAQGSALAGVGALPMRALPAAFVTSLMLLAVAAPASAEPPAPALPDAVMSDNVEYLGSIKQDIGLTTGAKVIGNRLFVTSGKNISIYDISNPASPQGLGSLHANVAWENEEVPTNGKVLAVASDFYSVGVPECVAALAVDGCIQFFDVRDPANIKQVGTVPIANHTAECALDCRYFYGRAGTIVEARGILDGKAPTVIGNWITELSAQLPKNPDGTQQKETSCHHI